MDQSKFNNPQGGSQLVAPKRSFSLEFFVGLVTAAGVAAAAYLAVGLAGLELSSKDTYLVYAEFDNISGLKYGASVEIAGVPIGAVSDISLKDPVARVTLKLNRSIKLKDDDIASIRTKGIIGDRYVKISRGASTDYIPEGGTMTETESVIDIEDVIGKVVHSLGGDKDEEPKTEEAKK
jgi:phospholipid/cholesterol/gamma-HCH transport system substrate-binding protein